VTQPFRDTCWQPLPCVSSRYRAWLVDRGSLTRRIEARSPGMTVQVLFQGRRRLHRDERFLARAHAYGALALTRDVALYCGKTPVVYAHSVLRPGDCGAGWRLMRGMGSRPLGAALFTDPRIRRLLLRQHKIRRGHELYRRLSPLLKSGGATAPLWARRSLFMVGKSPILVTEVFLPGVLAL
jgi:chorismate--pyruvate lyase